MNWKRLKTITLAALILLNICLGFKVFDYYRSLNYYSEKLITEVCEIMESGGISISPDLLKRKKETVPLLACSDAGEYSTNCAVKMSRAGIADSVSSEDGETVTTKNGDLYFFGNDFSFKYIRSGNIALDEAREKIERGDESLFSRKATQKEKREFLGSVYDFVFTDSEKEKLDSFSILLRTGEVYYSDELDCYIGYVGQYFEEKTAFDGDALFIVRSDSVKYASGYMLLQAPGEALKIEQKDIIEILLSEKSRVLEGGEGSQTLTVTALVWGYTVHKSEKSFYLVPTLKIVYKTSEVLYNLVSGKTE